ncbi:hypothetical protein EVAR_19104_1 [Eumeta japonica]|uniref:RNase H type-1 domain-containing protein n=1 Tax=Eumeta variegata TaxID=151549 RepID=A0A4C1UQY1_EUMVA|nr:hypothetical protein EVAR_19104_1 [Eumeta japonica]
MSKRNGDSTFRLETFCTVFQAEILTLKMAIKKVLRGTDKTNDILSDSISTLKDERCNVVGGGTAETYAGTADNEHADELAGNTALKKKTKADYDTTNHAKRVIRVASLEK